MTVAVGYDDLFLEHDTDVTGGGGDFHPENHRRLRSIMERLERSGLLQTMGRIAPRDVTDAELLRVHTREMIDRVRRVCQGGGGYLDGDTPVSRESYPAALRAAGMGVEAVERVLAGDLRRCFLAVRPPGHHATPSRSMGFCLFNNVAVAAAHALARGLARAAIIDWDVHHGNGTQDIFYQDPRVLYVSTHQYPLYPGTGRGDETGEGQGRGTTLNIPLPLGTGDRGYLEAFDRTIGPAIREFAPELLFLSAGFDAHAADPLAQMRVSSAGFAALTGRAAAWADEHCQGRVIAFLEGGYDLTALAESVELHIKALLEHPGAGTGSSGPGPRETPGS